MTGYGGALELPGRNLSGCNIWRGRYLRNNHSLVADVISEEK
jgi:hypothetical protein